MLTNLLKRLLPFLFALWMTSCLEGGGTEIPNELTGTVLSDRNPAAGAEIRLIPVDYVPGSVDTANTVILTTRTDAKGRYRVKDARPGTYNLIASSGGLSALVDSIGVTGKGQELGEALLRQPGTLIGKVELEPLDSPRNAVVQALGTTVYVNVEEDGSFALKDLPEGPYRLKVSVSLPLYVPLFREAKARAGKLDTLTPALKPFYSGIPTVLGLEVRAAPPGLLKLNWQPVTFANFESYAIYRDSAGSLVPSTQPIARTSSTSYTDTLYANPPKPGQHPYDDTLPHAFSYRVRVLDVNGDPGRSLAPVKGTAQPPSAVINSGWKLAANANLPMFPAGGVLKAFRDSAWYFVVEDSVMTIYVSHDLITWKARKPLDRFPMGPVLEFQGKLWMVGWREMDPGDPAYSLANPIVSVVRSTVDGIHWTVETARAPFEGRADCGFAAFKGRMWVVGGTGYSPSPINDTWYSADGKAWLKAGEKDFLGFPGAVIGFREALFQVGGGHYVRNDHPKAIQRTTDGNIWTSHPAPTGFLPRMAHSLLEHDGKLWVIGGLDNITFPETWKYLSDVWNSDDGLTWTQVDARPPFGTDGRQAISIRGRLYVARGYNSSSPIDDIWVLE